MYKVFIDNTPIYFRKNGKFSTNLSVNFVPKLDKNNFSDFKEEITRLSLENELFVASPTPKETMREFFADFQAIEAAGGLVRNTVSGHLLIIKRHGLWDIPKGVIEEGESPETGAIREVQEECGLEKMAITHTLSPTYHAYFAYGKHWIKKTYWYLMESDETVTAPQLEEDISETKWVNLDELSEIKKNTYASLLDVFKEAENLLR